MQEEKIFQILGQYEDFHFPKYLVTVQLKVKGTKTYALNSSGTSYNNNNNKDFILRG